VDGVLTASALDLRTRFRERSLSPVEVIEALAQRIAEVEPRLKAFVELTLDRAREEALHAANAYGRGTARPLEGLPLAVKDLYDTEGVRTTYGSPMFAQHVPTADAAAVRRAREAGAILIGKTSTHEFAWGLTSFNAHFDSGRNPWDLERVSGGSSGGSAAALASLETPLALGSDTGGSIRVPAAFCGVVGFKPTFGLVPTEGIFPLAPSLDHAGPMARTPGDAALLFSAIAGRSVEPVSSLEGLRVATSPGLLAPEPVPAVAKALESSLRALVELGAELCEVALPGSREILDVFVPLQQAEALRAHRAKGLWPERGGEYGDDVRGRLESAEAISFEDYVGATIARERIRSAFVSAFADADLIVSPVSPVSPPLLGEEEVDYMGETKLFRALLLRYTTPQDVIGAPACSVRAGIDELGVPVGIQLMGRPGADELVLGAAEALFAATLELQRQWPTP
jgi:aspartyl-tRNA(Asn)/glutamyl-tRNA(Gln) amidotransferase subunit A